jgi:large subunit ribosomal protein L23
MELGIYDIVKKVILTSKSLQSYSKMGHITLDVHISANKPMIADAVRKIWNVEVEVVRTSRKVGKNKISAGKRAYQCSDRKKAIVTLKKGYKIEMLEQFKAASVQQPAAE